jgi:hypothetical protein
MATALRGRLVLGVQPGAYGLTGTPRREPREQLSGVAQCSVLGAVPCRAVPCSAVPCRAVQRSAVQCSAVQCSAVQCSAVQCSAVHCSACSSEAVVSSASASPSSIERMRPSCGPPIACVRVHTHMHAHARTRTHASACTHDAHEFTRSTHALSACTDALHNACANWQGG